MRRVEPTLPACKQLRKGDVLLSFDGTQIGNDGTVAFRSGERINFSYLVSEKQNHEDVRAVALCWHAAETALQYTCLGRQASKPAPCYLPRWHGKPACMHT